MRKICGDNNSFLTCKEGLNFNDGKCLEVCVNGSYSVNSVWKNVK